MNEMSEPGLYWATVVATIGTVVLALYLISAAWKTTRPSQPRRRRYATRLRRSMARRSPGEAPARKKVYDGVELHESECVECGAD